MLNYFSKTVDDKFRKSSDDSSTECEGGGLNADALKALNSSNKQRSSFDDSDGNSGAK